MNKKLSEICDIQSGGTPSRSVAEYWTGGNIPWVKISDFEGKYLQNTEEFITEEGLNNSSAKIFKAGTILYTIFATLGEVCVLDIDAATNQAIAGITIKNDAVNKDYLYHYLYSLKKSVIEKGRGVAQNNINMTILKNIEIPLHPLEIQHEIAYNLDKVSEAIELCQKILEKLDYLVKAKFAEMFGGISDSNRFNQCKIEELCNVSSSKRIYQNEQSQNGIPFLRISDLVNLIETGSLTCELFIPSDKYCALKEKGQTPLPGDILITSRGTLGKCYIVKETDSFYFQDGMISWLRNINSNITSLFISMLFSMPHVQNQISKFQAGSTVAYLSIDMIKRIIIPVPPLHLQEQFAEYVKKTDLAKSAVKKTLEKAQTLKNALMQKYFG